MGLFINVVIRDLYFSLILFSELGKFLNLFVFGSGEG